MVLIVIAQYSLLVIPNAMSLPWLPKYDWIIFTVKNICHLGKNKEICQDLLYVANNYEEDVNSLFEAYNLRLSAGESKKRCTAKLRW